MQFVGGEQILLATRVGKLNSTWNPNASPGLDPNHELRYEYLALLVRLVKGLVPARVHPA
jgi:hypothetical protein